jgi:hypothetical protein
VDFLINNTTGENQVNVDIDISNNKALVVWESKTISNTELRGRFINIYNGEPDTTGDFRINDVILGDSKNPQIASFDNQALVVWQSNNGIENDIHYRLVSYVGSPSDSSGDDYILSANEFDQVNPQLFIKNKKAFILWEEGISPDIDIIGKIYDLEKEQVTFDDDLYLTATTTENQIEPSLFYGDKKGLLVWKSNHNALDYNIYGQIIDINSVFGLPYGNNNFFKAPLIERNYLIKSRVKY